MLVNRAGGMYRQPHNPRRPYLFTFSRFLAEQFWWCSYHILALLFIILYDSDHQSSLVRYKDRCYFSPSELGLALCAALLSVVGRLVLRLLIPAWAGSRQTFSSVQFVGLLPWKPVAQREGGTCFHARQIYPCSQPAGSYWSFRLSVIQRHRSD